MTRAGCRTDRRQWIAAATRMPRPTRLAGMAMATLAAAMLVGCGGTAPTRTALPTDAPSTVATEPGGSTAPTSGPTGEAAIAVDASLLDLLPAQVSGVPLEPDAETAAELALDPALAATIDRIAVATAFGPLSTDTPGDYAVVTIAGLRAGAFSEAVFRDWRDTFDAAVCDQAGGVSGHGETMLGEHQVWIGTCAGGVHTYHATLRNDSVIVSLQGLGPGRFGEQIMAGLTE